MDRSQRCIFFLAAAVLAALLPLKGHSPSQNVGDVAFVPWTTSRFIVRLEGNVQSPGVYTLPSDGTALDVIKLTEVFPPAWLTEKPASAARLSPGDVVTVASDGPQKLAISVKTMKAGERMLLGIPLDPLRMDRDDWAALPGIGPKMAKSIEEYRQIYGDFDSVEAIRSVPGMGEKRYRLIHKFFADL